MENVSTRTLWLTVAALLAGCTERLIEERYDLSNATDLARMCEDSCSVVNCDPEGGLNLQCLENCVDLEQKRPWMEPWCVDIVRDAQVCIAALSCSEFQQRGTREYLCFDELELHHASIERCWARPGED